MVYFMCYEIDIDYYFLLNLIFCKLQQNLNQISELVSFKI